MHLHSTCAIWATQRRGSCVSRKICRGHPLPAHFFNKCITRKCLTLKMKVKVTEHNIHNDVIQQRLLTSVKVIWRIFAIALTVSDIVIFLICDLENLGPDYGVQHSQWTHSTANINIYKSHTWALFVSTHWQSLFSRYSYFKMCDLDNIGQVHDVQHLL